MPKHETFFAEIMAFYKKKGIFVTEKCQNTSFGRKKMTGEMLEWLKRHAWKACNRQKRFRGSNPRLSARKICGEDGSHKLMLL